MAGATGLAAALARAAHAVVLTGAGASTDSGLPDFRSQSGIWAGVDPMRLASLTALRRTPVEFYSFYRQRLSRLGGAMPNSVHLSLAALEAAGRIQAVITQNVDGLHQAGGSHNVVELHGSLRECVCLDCQQRFSSDLIDVEVGTPEQVPRCPACGGVLKPGVVLFEEALPFEAIDAGAAEAHSADLFIVVGSSLEVGPANQLPVMALAGGADLAIINLEPTWLDTRARWVIQERAAGVLISLCRELGL